MSGKWHLLGLEWVTILSFPLNELETIMESKQ